MKDQIEKYELSESIYMSGHGLDRKDSDDIAEQLYTEGYRKQSEGEWIWKSNGYMNALHCSLCNKTAELHHKFCPNCGAKMFVQTEIKDYPPYLDRPKMKGGAE